MSATKEFVKTMLKDIQDQLLGLGFKKCKWQIYTLSLANEEVIGWLGLNTGTHRSDSALSINPMIGVRHQEIEALVAKLTGRLAHRCIPPTIVHNLTHDMPPREHPFWYCIPGEDNSQEIDVMVTAINTYGRQFIERDWSLDVLIKTVQKNPQLGNYREYIVPVGLGMLERVGDAEAFIGSELKRINGRTDEAADDYRKFAVNLQQWLSLRS
jgi:hypothetical protein